MGERAGKSGRARETWVNEIFLNRFEVFLKHLKNICVTKRCGLGKGYGTIVKLLAAHARGQGLDPQHPCKSQVSTCSYNPSLGVKMGDLKSSLLASLRN